VIYTLANETARKRAMQAVAAAKPGWVVSIQPPNRTSAQNSFYWVTLTAISEQIRPQGKEHSPDIWHAYFKARYLPGRMLELPNGRVVEQEPTTTGLTKEQFSDYVEKVFAWATSHGLVMTDEMSVLRVDSDTTTQDSSLSLMAP
jgi:hypothetical protein